MKLTVRDRLLGSSALIGAALCFGGSAAAQAAGSPPASTETPVAPNTPASAPAFGPDVSAAALSKNANGQTPTSVQEVVVTGSRIRSPSLTSTSPLTVVGSQEILNTGATAVETVLNELPSVVAGQNSGLANLSNGTATVNLRGLGAARTLVLVDGKRLMPGDPQTPVADLNVIPSGLVDRVDIVTGGASAVYGSDAVAGVVNFIMKKDFQGFRFEVTDDAAQHHNGDTTEEAAVAASNFQQAPKSVYQNLGTNFSAIMGVNAPDGKGNITAYAGYRHLEPILEQLYDSSACTISASQGKSTDSSIYAGHACGGSSNGLYGKFTPTSVSKSFGGSSKTLHDALDGSPAFITTAVPSYNYGATNYFQRSETRYTGGFFGHYDVNPSLSIYSDFMFADDQTVGQIAPSGLFGGTGANGLSTYNINCNNPLLTATQQGQLCGTAAGTAQQVPYLIGYRFASFPRDYGYGHIDYKFDIGARGTLGEAWSYDAYLQYGTSILSNLLRNDVSTSKVQNALLVDPTTGACLTGGASCVPLNIFRAGGVTSAMFNYVSVPAEQQGSTIEQVASASITGDLGHYGVKSPLATDGVGVALGTEYRRESLTFTPDNEYLTTDLSGTGTAKANAGSFDVYELFGEVRVPLVQNAPFIKDLNFNGGYRFSDYNTAGVTDTYKLQFEYAPTADIRFRGGYNRATRAPNVVELFKSQTVNLGAGPDPCTGAKPAASLAACVATGLPAALYGNFSTENGCPAGQCGALVGGNPALKPETSDTYTGGFVLTPTASFARGFTLSVDYFNIRVNNVITSIPTSVSASTCAAGNLVVCSTLLHRDPSTFVLYGQQGYIVSTQINSGYLSTDGVDIEANYRKRLSDIGLPDWGVVSLNLLATYTHSFIDQPVVGEGTYNCAGFYGASCGNPLPKIKGKFRMTYAPSFAPVTISAAWRYVGPVKLDGNTTNALLTNHPYGITDVIDNSIHPFSYLDATVTWRIRDKVTFTAGCNNLLDKDPPVVDSGIFVDAGTTAGNGNTYPGVYDQLGRTVFATLTADF